MYKHLRLSTGHEKGTVIVTDTEIREAHKRLMKVHTGIRRVFSDLDETTLVGIYGDEYLGEVRKYGDGHTLWAVPNCIGELMGMLSDTELVLAVGKFPYLGKNSEFNPHEDLANIASWHDEIRSKESELREFPSQQFRFWAWQNDYPVHGRNASRAKVNKNRLLDCNQELDQ